MMADWGMRYQHLPPAELMLISGDPWWYMIPTLEFMESTILCAHPKNLPPSDKYLSLGNTWVWEELLEGVDSALDEISSHTDYVGPPAICRVCNIDIESCVELINHLKTDEEHIAKAINEHFLSGGYESTTFEVVSIDAQKSVNDGVFIKVVGFSTGKDKTKKKFSQMFYLTHDISHKNPNSYVVLNDMFRYVSEEASTPRTLPVVKSSFKKTTFTKTVVLWDLDTCPVPADIEPGRVRQIIESALRHYLGETRQFSFYALGDLEDISDDLLKEISSSGFLLRHATSGWFNLFFLFFLEFIGSTILCAHPKYLPPSGEYLSLGNIWVWEELLQGDDSGLHEISSDTDYVGPPAICTVCNVDIESCDELINHLKTDEEHIELFSSDSDSE
ncbi:unnamed protein product [Microthlaspi erraticum]|uniref:NTF2 domain-containing protein n=1 Tax=Microthlaspi erraticum TaxID=1685480 RepID=A0A6D2HEZ8_9BRAS|nr:unnamed protein product [Microthlaspi erraticum]